MQNWQNLSSGCGDGKKIPLYLGIPPLLQKDAANKVLDPLVCGFGDGSEPHQPSYEERGEYYHLYRWGKQTQFTIRNRTCKIPLDSVSVIPKSPDSGVQLYI